MTGMIVVVSRRDGSAGMEMAGGSRILYAPSWREAIRLAAARGAHVLVLAGYTARECFEIARAARRALPEVPIAALLGRRASQAEERRLIECGADAVALYPMPFEAWRGLVRLLVRKRQPAAREPREHR